MMPVDRTRYDEFLGFPDGEAKDRALKRAHDIRKFEIDLYWKRANHFWLLQAAVFTAIGFVWSGGNGTPTGVAPWAYAPVGLAALGFLTALAGTLSLCGSKFWQENWEAHIDALEDEIEGKLHKAVWLRQPSWSVSRLNQVLYICFTCFWALIFLHEMNGYAPPLLQVPVSEHWVLLVVTGVFVFFATVALVSQKTRTPSDRTTVKRDDKKELRIRNP